MPLALIRPSAWNMPLFVHVLGAMSLVGGMLALTLLAIAARRGPNTAMFARMAFQTALLVVLPAWIVMRVGAQLIVNKEYPSGASQPGWVGVGFIVSEPALVVILLPLVILGWRSARAGGGGRAATAVAVLSAIYLAALGVAWFAMSAKPS